MTRYDRRIRALAACLSGLAGYVDAFGFIELGGFFVSFMSGNSTRLGVGFSQRASDSLAAAGLIAAFVLGVVVGTAIGRLSRRRASTVLLLVGGLLAAGALAGAGGLTAVAAALMAMAMGAENAVFERDGEVSIGLTYMTGALVKLGQHVTGALLGGPPWAWAPYLMLWLGLVAGAGLGAVVHARLGLDGLWAAAAAAVLMGFAADRLHPSHEPATT